MFVIEKKLKCADDMIALVREIGFLPLFNVGVKGFSVEEMTPGQWWTGKSTDPWGWREEAARSKEIIYGKFFSQRAGFVSKDWFKKFANYRRDGYDFDSRWEEGLATPKAKDIMECVWNEKSIMTSEIKKKVGKSSFEGTLTNLQMQTYLVISDFDRKKDRFQNPYGWSIAVMQTPEDAFGIDIATGAYDEAPQKSFEDILKHLKGLISDKEENNIVRIMK